MSQPTQVQWMNIGKTAVGILLIVAGGIKIGFPEAHQMVDLFFIPLVKTVSVAVPVDPNWTPDAMTLIMAGFGVAGVGLLDKVRKWLRAHPKIATWVNRILAAKHPMIAAMLVDPPAAVELDLNAIRSNQKP